MLTEEEKELMQKVVNGSKELQSTIRLYLNILHAADTIYDRGPINPHFPGTPGDDPRVIGPGWTPSDWLMQPTVGLRSETEPFKRMPVIVGMGGDDHFHKLWMAGTAGMGFHIRTPWRSYVSDEGGSTSIDTPKSMIRAVDELWGNWPMKAEMRYDDDDRPTDEFRPIWHPVPEDMYDGWAREYRFIAGGDPTYGSRHEKLIGQAFDTIGAGVQSRQTGKLAAMNEIISRSLGPIEKMSEGIVSGMGEGQKSLRRQFINGMIIGCDFGTPLTQAKPNFVVKPEKELRLKVMEIPPISEKTTSKKHKKRRY
jgi:hypothetical protein